MEEIHHTTCDEYGLKEAQEPQLGVLASLERLFGLKLGHLLYGGAEETSTVLQAKDTSVQEAISAVNLTQAYYQRQRDDDAFEYFYKSIVSLASKLQINEPKLPRYRKTPARLGGSQPHQFSSPKALFRQQYFAACDVLIEELADRFEQKTVMKPVLAVESLLLKSANGQNFDEDLKAVQDSVFQSLTIETLNI